MAEKKAAPKKAAPTKRPSAASAQPESSTDQIDEPTTSAGEAAEPTPRAATAEREANAVLEAVGPRIRVAPREWNRRHGGFLVFHYESRDVRLPCDGASAVKAVKHFEQNDAGGELDELDANTPAAHRGWMSMTSTGLLGVSWEFVPRLPDRITLDPASDETDKVQQQIDSWTGTHAAGRGVQ